MILKRLENCSDPLSANKGSHYLSKTATRGFKKYWELTIVKHGEFSGRIWPTGHSTLKAAKLWVARNYNPLAKGNGFYEPYPYDGKNN